jgi:hypothetical protein
MDEPPLQYQSLLLAAARAKKIRWGVQEGGMRSVRRTKDGRGVSGSDMLAAIIAESGREYRTAHELWRRWETIGGGYTAFLGTLLAFRKQGYVDELNIAKDSGGVMRGSYRLNDGYLTKRKARAAKGATRAFEVIFES